VALPDDARRSLDAHAVGRTHQWLVSAPPFAVPDVFFLLPALIMVVASFRYPGEFGALAPIFGRRRARDRAHARELRLLLRRQHLRPDLPQELRRRALTTLVCLVMAYPVALLIARSPHQYRDLLVLLCVLPFASNFLVRVYAWMIILGPLDLLFSRFAVIVGLVYVHLPFMILPLYTNLEKHDPTLLDAAQDLGANGWSRFWRVTFPLSLPASSRARPSCSFRCSACSPFPRSSAARTTGSSAT
jgi:spermidine/putrescine transport system permease protein